MEWIVLILMVLSYLTARKNGASQTEALLGAAVVGAGAYYVGTQTDWGKATVSQIESALSSTGSGETLLKDADGNAVKVNGQPVTTSGKNVYDVLTAWGATGTATVIGTTAAATGSGIFSNMSKWLPWVGLGVGALLLVRS